jgi:U32 family peptidase
MTTKPELLAPAGNLEKLETAYRYGADAAYIGTESFSLRSRADNFGVEKISDLKKIKAGKRLYGALNIYFHDEDLRVLDEELENLAKYPFDALIVSDPGAAAFLRKRMPDVPLHLSTQANCVNSESVKWYRDCGFTRIILGRELSLSQIEAIRAAAPDVELETFVHGAMCWAYSGRCYLSSYLASRSANEGNCAHSCRWEYRVLEERKRPGEYLPIVEGDGYTTVLSSKDLFMLDHIRALRDTGIDSLKIEGRMKSVYYAAVITRAYRHAIDEAAGMDVPDMVGYRDEVFKVSHREFSTGFYFDDPNALVPNESEYQRSHIFLGTIDSVAGPGMYRVNIKNQIGSDDTIEYIGPDILFLKDTDFVLLDESFTPVKAANHGHVHYIKTTQPLKIGYILRRETAP